MHIGSMPESALPLDQQTEIFIIDQPAKTLILVGGNALNCQLHSVMLVSTSYEAQSFSK